MADIAVGDVTYSLLRQRIGDTSLKKNLVQLTFGDSALTYPAGGIPISIGKLGCPTEVQSLVVVAKGTSGYAFSYDRTNSKLVLIQAPVQSHTHDIKVIGGLTADEPMAVNASVIFSKNAATNRTITGANSATNGGIVSATLAAAAGSQPSTVAIAQQIIECEVVGW